MDLCVLAALLFQKKSVSRFRRIRKGKSWEKRFKYIIIRAQTMKRAVLIEGIDGGTTICERSIAAVVWIGNRYVLERLNGRGQRECPKCSVR